ncbi:MAG: mannose-1-phosphate guanylyltransferase [Bacteroidales bacterium]|nr:mannose-1-phosphate guanylyltransferase [Bacteroidales bacterium]
MAGGSGSRLWPLSTPGRPKQFLDLLGMGKSLLQLTVERFSSLSEDFWVVTGADYESIVREQLPFLPGERILLEPEGRNTAPCIAYACWKIRQKYPDANVVVTPSDAIVLEGEKFARCIRTALQAVTGTGSIVTLGIAPTEPKTGYGYICASSIEKDKVVKVNSFREKPDLATATEYLREGNYFWNAGIFVWSVETAVQQIRLHAPGIASVMDELAPSLYGKDEPEALSRLFPKCEKISIDYAVMEKSDSIYVIATDLSWSDLGTWDSLRQYIPSDGDGNSVVGAGVRLHDCKGCVVEASDNLTVVVQGLQNYIVAAADGRILVCALDHGQQVREYSQM